MHLVIAKVNEVLFDGDAQSVTLPGAEGEMTVLGHHEPLVTTLRAGNIVVRAPGLPDRGSQQFPIAGGILEVSTRGATVIL